MCNCLRLSSATEDMSNYAFFSFRLIANDCLSAGTVFVNGLQGIMSSESVGCVYVGGMIKSKANIVCVVWIECNSVQRENC